MTSNTIVIVPQPQAADAQEIGSMSLLQVQVNAVLKDPARFSSELVPQRAKFTAGLVAAARAAFEAALKAPDIARLEEGIPGGQEEAQGPRPHRGVQQGWDHRSHGHGNDESGQGGAGGRGDGNGGRNRNHDRRQGRQRRQSRQGSQRRKVTINTNGKTVNVHADGCVDPNGQRCWRGKPPTREAQMTHQINRNLCPQPDGCGLRCFDRAPAVLKLEEQPRWFPGLVM